VNDPFLVARGERIGERRANLQHLPERQPAARNHLVQALPLDPLHRQEADVAVLLDRVDGDDSSASHTSPIPPSPSGEMIVQ